MSCICLLFYRDCLRNLRMAVKLWRTWGDWASSPVELCLQRRKGSLLFIVKRKLVANLIGTLLDFRWQLLKECLSHKNSDVMHASYIPHLEHFPVWDTVVTTKENLARLSMVWVMPLLHLLLALCLKEKRPSTFSLALIESLEHS